MNIYKLYEELQDENLLDSLKGELTLDGNCIIWTYDIGMDSEEFNEDNNIDIETDEIEFTSTSELLNEAYTQDAEKIETYIADLDMGEWQFSDADILDNVISFKIF